MLYIVDLTFSTSTLLLKVFNFIFAPLTVNTLGGIKVGGMSEIDNKILKLLYNLTGYLIILNSLYLNLLNLNFSVFLGNCATIIFVIESVRLWSPRE